jgi:probable HAF family extracellular repeat protein
MRRFYLPSVLLPVLLLLIVAVAAQSASSMFTTLDVPFASVRSTMALGINNLGQIVGTYLDDLGQHGFLDHHGTFTAIDVPRGQSTIAEGINDKGQIVGFYSQNGSHGFVYDHGTFTTIDEPQSNMSMLAIGINNEGQIVGWYSDLSASHGFLDDAGVFASIKAWICREQRGFYAARSASGVWPWRLRLWD